jgi:hypothetical protein
VSETNLLWLGFGQGRIQSLIWVLESPWLFWGDCSTRSVPPFKDGLVSRLALGLAHNRLLFVELMWQHSQP